MWNLAEEIYAVSSSLFNTDELRRCVFQALSYGANAAAIASQEENSQAIWQEFHNKVEAFRLFEFAPTEAAAQHISAHGILETLDAVRLQGAYRALWLAEGLGYFWSGRGLEGQFLKRSRLPSWSVIPLHAGCGLRLAESCLRRISCGRGDAPAIRRELELFFHEIHHQARPGFIEILYEALGLYARNLFPELIFKLDRQMSSCSLPVRDFFWHGIGRGAYFAPSNLPPWRSNPWRIFETIATEAPDQSAFCNLLAGSAWALCLVNIRTPQVMESVLCHHGSSLQTIPAFRNGIVSSLCIWNLSSAEDHTALNDLRQYEEQIPEAAIRHIWQELFGNACGNVRVPPLCPPGDLFRFRPDFA
jgi:hypothetical protein